MIKVLPTQKETVGDNQMTTNSKSKVNVKNKSTKLLVTSIATAVAMFSATSTFSQDNYPYNDNYKYNSNNNYESYTDDHSNIDFAKVISVNDVIDRVEYSEPVEKCHNKRVRVKRDRRYSSRSHYPNRSIDSRTPDILGAVIGAAVGNQVGKRGSSSGRRAATVAGALLGGSLGRDNRKRNDQARYHGDYNDYHHAEYKTVRQCETFHETRYKNKVVGYDVKYRYRGKVYSTRMNENPGKRIKVKVEVTPIYS